MLRKETMRSYLVTDREFAKELNRIVAKIHFLHITQSRANKPTASPETIMLCREKVFRLLDSIVEDIIALNDSYGKSIMEFVPELDKIQTKWNLVDKFYLIAVDFMTDAEATQAIMSAANM